MRSKFLLSMLFVYALAGAFLLFAANHVYALWSGGFALWPIALPALTLGGAAGWGAHRWGERFVGPRVLALLATLAAAMAAFTLGNLAGMVHDWTFLSLRSLRYSVSSDGGATDGSLTVKGSASVYDVMDALGRDFSLGGYEEQTITGYIMFRTGRSPVVGDTVDSDGVTIRVLSVEGHRVRECRVMDHRAPPDEQAES